MRLNTFVLLNGFSRIILSVTHLQPGWEVFISMIETNPFFTTKKQQREGLMQFFQIRFEIFQIRFEIFHESFEIFHEIFQTLLHFYIIFFCLWFKSYNSHIFFLL